MIVTSATRRGTKGTNLACLLLFAAASLACVVAGAATLSASGASPASWIRNPIAWLAGLAIAAGIFGTGRTPLLCRIVVAVAVVGLFASLLAPGQQGVHRWLDLGPLHVNVAALLLPSAIVALATVTLGGLIAVSAAALIAVLLVGQPDASQATAFIAATIFLLVRSPLPKTTRIAAGAGAVALAVAAWLRPDPLQPVPEVERIFVLAWEVAPTLAVLAAVALGVAALAPLRAGAPNEMRASNAAIALAVYFGVVGLAPFLGAFPVPLVGLGMSFPIGYWVAVGLLCARDKARGE